MTALSVLQAKPITDGVIANGLLLYLPPASLHSSNKYPRDNERENRDKLLKRRGGGTSYSTGGHEEKKQGGHTHTQRQTFVVKDGGKVRGVTNNSARVEARLLQQQRVKERKGGGSGRGW